MKIKLAINSVFVVLLLFGAGAIDASPVSLGNAGGFAALSLGGNLNDANGTITGPAGVAASGFTYTGDSTFRSALYVNTGDTITLNGAVPSSTNQNTATNAYLSQAITNANNASAAATARGPGTNLGNLGNGAVPNLTNAAVGNYVYTIGNVGNNVTFDVEAPAGSTVIINITGTMGANDVALTTSGITASNVLYNITGTSSFQISGTWNGIILAPTSTVTVSGGGVVTGQAIAQAITTTGSGTITGSGLSPIVIVPEPTSLSIVAIGAAALLGNRFLRRRKSPG